MQHVSSLGATQSIVLIKNYTVFQSDAPAIFYCNGSGYENGAFFGWLLNGTIYGSKHAQRGITYVIDPPIGDRVSSRLFIPSNSAINNGTEVKCKIIDSISSIANMSEPANLTIQGDRVLFNPMKVYHIMNKHTCVHAWFAYLISCGSHVLAYACT